MDWTEFFKQATAFVTGVGILLGIMTQIGLQIAKMINDARRNAMLDGKVDEVKTTLEARTAEQSEHLAKQDETLASVVGKVEEVHKATNSMKDALVLSTEKEALARGTAEGRAARIREEARGETGKGVG